MVWQVSPASVSRHTQDPLVRTCSPRALQTLVPIMPFVPILRTTWGISVNAKQGGKASCATMISTNVSATHVKTVGRAQIRLVALSALVEVDSLGLTVKQTSTTVLQIPV